MNSMQLSQRLTRKRDSDSSYAEALSSYERRKRAEEEFEPKKELIIVRESIDQEIRELKAQHPKPSRSMRKMIDELIAQRDRVQDAILLLGKPKPVEERHE